MAEFICRFGTPAGEVVTRTVEAAGVNEARSRLEREGFRVFNVAPPQNFRSGRTYSVWSSRWLTRALRPTTFCSSISNWRPLIRAGIPILQAITMLRKRAASARLRAVLGRSRRADSRRRGAVAGLRRPGSDLSANLYGLDSCRRTIGRTRRRASRYVTYMRRNVAFATKDSRRAWLIRCSCCLRRLAWSCF